MSKLFAAKASQSPPAASEPFDLDAALTAAAADLASAQDALGRTATRLEALLTSGADDSAIEAAEMELSRARRAVDRASVRESELQAMVPAHRAAQMEAQFVEWYPRYVAADEAFRAALEAVFETRKQLIGIIDEGVAKFPGRTSGFTVGPLPFWDAFSDRQGLDFQKQYAETARANERRRGKGDW
jgi:hypothetical protein